MPPPLDLAAAPASAKTKRTRTLPRLDIFAATDVRFDNMPTNPKAIKSLLRHTVVKLETNTEIFKKRAGVYRRKLIAAEYALRNTTAALEKKNTPEQQDKKRKAPKKKKSDAPPAKKAKTTDVKPQAEDNDDEEDEDEDEDDEDEEEEGEVDDEDEDEDSDEDDE